MQGYSRYKTKKLSAAEKEWNLIKYKEFLQKYQTRAKHSGCYAWKCSQKNPQHQLRKLAIINHQPSTLVLQS